MGLLTKLFGTRSQRELKKIQPTVDKILALEDDYKALSEEALKAGNPQSIPPLSELSAEPESSAASSRRFNQSFP